MTLYGSSKREGESLCLEKGGKVLVARTNFIGGDLSKHKNRGLFNHFATNLSQGLKVQGYAKVYFNPITIEALTKITQEVIVRNITGTLHIAGREKISKYEFAINIARYLGVKPNLVDKADYDPNSTKVFRRIMNLDVKRMLALGFEPGSLEEGIQELCRKFLMVRQAL
jgi:dTDP-4-dehydrorhamnose reductase